MHFIPFVTVHCWHNNFVSLFDNNYVQDARHGVASSAVADASVVDQIAVTFQTMARCEVAKETAPSILYFTLTSKNYSLCYPMGLFKSQLSVPEAAFGTLR